MPEVNDVVGGRYRLLKRLGAGGMGEVWLAEHLVLHHEVALKCARSENAVAARRMRREGRNAARLNHPNIVRVYDVVEDGRVTWLVMEYVESESLAQKAQRRLLTPDQAAAVGRQIADALAEVHKQDTVHGDVTPENILVKADGTAKLADFGISRARWTELSETTAPGLRGKLRYLPPEVANGNGATRESDMFMLGAALYAALEGTSPLGAGDDPFELWNKAKEGRITPPTRTGWITGPIMALLRTDPGQRPGAAEAGRLLGEPGPAAPAAAPEVIGPPAPGSRRSPGGGTGRTRLLPPGTHTGPPSPPRWRRPVLAAAAVLLAGVLAGLLATRPWDGGPSGTVAVMGEPRTADPCALIGAAALARFGGAHQDAHYANFDRCDVLLGTHGDDVVDTYVTLLGRDEGTGTRAAATRTGSVTVHKEARDGAYCDRLLTLADGYHVAVTAHRLPVPGPAPAVCAVADAATRHATAVLNRGPVPRRPSAPAAASLIRLNACELLGTTALSTIPGVDARHPERDFAGWGCRWQSTTSRASAQLLFDQGQTPDPQEAQPTRLGGREAYLTPGEAGPRTCLAQIVHREFSPAAGDHVAEMIKLRVWDARSARHACVTAEALGTDAAKRLPRP